MKKIIGLILFLTLTSLLLADVVSFTYTFEKPRIKTEDGYTELIYENCVNLGQEGEPLLPQLGAEILLSQAQELETIKIISTRYYEQKENIKLKPASKQFPISQKVENYVVIPNEKIYNSSLPYPVNIVANSGTHFLSGHCIAAFTICPVKYIPVEEQVELLAEISVEIHTKPSVKAFEAERFLRISPEIETRLNRILDNPDARFSYNYPNITREDEYDILLISNSSLLPVFDDYIEFKESTGYLVAAVTIEDIYTTYEGVDNAEKVRNCIIDYYENYYISSVILGGDTDAQNPTLAVVPHRGFSVATDPSLPSDMYFSGLDGNWNNDGDNYWGEYGEYDLYSEIIVGRICVDSATEIINFTNKLLMYQDSPVIEDIEKALMIGEELNNNPWTFGGDYKDEVADGSTNNGYTSAAISDNFTVEKIYDRDMTWTKYTIFDQFNNVGINLMNHLGHSSPTYNMKMNNSDLTTVNFTNDGITRGYAIGYSQGCYNGSFDNWHFSGYYTEDCFAEKLTTLETGQVACIANSRYGWYQPGGTNSTSQYYDRMFYDGIFGQDITVIGETNRYSHEADVSYAQFDQYYRWVFYQTNLFGDPTMDIWTAEPDEIFANYPPSIPIGSEQIQFQTDAPFARIAVLQNDELIGRIVADESGLADLTTFSTITTVNEITVSIIAHNKIRHQGTIVVVSDQPYVIYNSYLINDELGNGNGLADYSEEISLNMVFYNVGNQIAYNVNATLLTDDEYLTITDAEEDIGTVPAEETITFDNAFALQIENIIPDQHRVDFELEITGESRDTWISYFSVILNAPVLMVEDIIIDDSSGDNDGILDPGETATLTIPTYNIGHADSPTATASLSCANELITIEVVNDELDIIEAESSENAIFTITADGTMNVGTPIILDFNVLCEGYDEYNLQNNFVHTVGLILEDFETGDFSSFDWGFEGNANWIVETQNPYEGVYCVESGNIGSDQSSSLILELDVQVSSELKFWKKVSSEDNYDFFGFYVDDVLQNQWSGTVSWSEESYIISSGHHRLEWEYMKDDYMDVGYDCAWLDYIVMPVISGLGPPEIVLSQESFQFNLTGDETASQTLEISNNGEADLFYEIFPDFTGSRDYGGPDSYGYQWFDSYALNGPVYSWRDISDVGIQVNFTHNDIGTDLMPMDFTFNYYGTDYDEFRINPNGWIGFGDDNDEWQNTAIPSSDAPRPAILAYWDDLRPFDGTEGGGDVYYYSTPDSLIVWFDHVIHYQGTYNGTYDFEIIIYPNGEILTQYRTVSGDIDTATIGIQNEEGNIGLQVVFNDDYVEDELAILFKKVDVWLDLSENNGTIESGQSEFITLTANSEGFEPGDYLCNLLIASNDEIQSVITVPVDLHVNPVNTDDEEIPLVTGLNGNFPNPFNPTTTIKFTTSLRQGSAGQAENTEENTELIIYNIKGQKVKQLVSSKLSAGHHSVVWNGKDDSGKNVSSGVYFYRLKSGKYTSTKKMILMK